MKSHTDRPIGKCNGCCSNYKTFCKVGLMPKSEWDRGRCRHYNDTTLLDKILNAPPPSGAHLARVKRKAKAALMATEPHYNGAHDPGRMAGLARRR